MTLDLVGRATPWAASPGDNLATTTLDLAGQGAPAPFVVLTDDYVAPDPDPEPQEPTRQGDSLDLAAGGGPVGALWRQPAGNHYSGSLEPVGPVGFVVAIYRTDDYVAPDPEIPEAPDLERSFHLDLAAGGAPLGHLFTRAAGAVATGRLDALGRATPLVTVYETVDAAPTPPDVPLELDRLNSGRLELIGKATPATLLFRALTGDLDSHRLDRTALGAPLGFLTRTEDAAPTPPDAPLAPELDHTGSLDLVGRAAPAPLIRGLVGGWSGESLDLAAASSPLGALFRNDDWVPPAPDPPVGGQGRRHTLALDLVAAGSPFGGLYTQLAGDPFSSGTLDAVGRATPLAAIYVSGSLSAVAVSATAAVAVEARAPVGRAGRTVGSVPAGLALAGPDAEGRAGRAVEALTGGLQILGLDCAAVGGATALTALAGLALRAPAPRVTGQRNVLVGTQPCPMELAALAATARTSRTVQAQLAALVVAAHAPEVLGVRNVVIAVGCAALLAAAAAPTPLGRQFMVGPLVSALIHSGRRSSGVEPGRNSVGVGPSRRRSEVTR